MGTNFRRAGGVFAGIFLGLTAGWLIASVQAARYAAKAEADICAKQMQINELKEQIGMLKYRLGDRE
jgi:hypothetical protein